MTLQERLRVLFPEEDRGRQAEIARLCGVKPASVSAWFKNEAKTKTLNLRYAQIICARFAPHISPYWLSDGTLPKLVLDRRASHATAGPHVVDERVRPYIVGTDNVSRVPSFTSVPLVSWVAAGDFCGVHDPFLPGDAEEWYPVPTKHGPRTFALRVRGPSMLNRGAEQSFKDGDIIFVDPDVQAKHRDLVVVRLDDHGEATFKRLLIDGDSRILEAINPDWPERYLRVNQNATICGVVIAKTEVF